MSPGQAWTRGGLLAGEGVQAGWIGDGGARTAYGGDGADEEDARPARERGVEREIEQFSRARNEGLKGGERDVEVDAPRIVDDVRHIGL